LKTSSYPKEWDDLHLEVSFGMGTPAHVPWIAFLGPEMKVSWGFYPVYLYYKALNTLILAYGISETEEFSKTWPPEIMNSTTTITGFFNKDVPLMEILLSLKHTK
jgi:5-methylcytosine-specific restriction enzyme B